MESQLDFKWICLASPPILVPREILSQWCNGMVPSPDVCPRVVRVWKSSHVCMFLQWFRASCWGHKPLPSQKKRPLKKIAKSGVTMVRSGCAPLGRPSAKSEGWVQFTISCRVPAVWSSLVRRQVGTKNTTENLGKHHLLSGSCGLVNRNFPSLSDQESGDSFKNGKCLTKIGASFTANDCAPLLELLGNERLLFENTFSIGASPTTVQTSEQWYLLWQSNLAKHQWHHKYQSLQMNW